jgi:hypothetical protein
LVRLEGQLTKPEKKELAALVRYADHSKRVGVKISERDLITAALSRDPKGKKVAGYEVVRRCLVMGRGTVNLDKLETALFSPRKSRPHNPEIPFRSFGRKDARVGMSLHFRGYSPSISNLVFRCLAQAARELEFGFGKPIEFFK